MWMPANRVRRTAVVAHAWSKKLKKLAYSRSSLEQAADGLPAITVCVVQLGEQFALGPRGIAPCVPIGQQTQRIASGQAESARQPAADVKRSDVSALAGDRGRHRSQVTARPRQNVWLSQRSCSL
jgi:hypothetical protein